MRANTGTASVQMSPMLPFLLMNSDLSTDNGIVMMALMIDQLGNNQTQESFQPNRAGHSPSFVPLIPISKIHFCCKTPKDEHDVTTAFAGPSGNIKRQPTACSCNDYFSAFLSHCHSKKSL